MQAEIAERLVEFEWPDKSELSAAKLKEIEASVPIPERVWALKNVGATQAMSGPEGRARARQLLERAVGLKRELVGSAKHPGRPPPPPPSTIINRPASFPHQAPRWHSTFCIPSAMQGWIDTSIP